MLPATPAGFYQRIIPPRAGAGSSVSSGLEELRKEQITMAKDGPRIIVKMESTAGTGFYYTTTKNRRNTQAKLELRKYDPMAKKHVVFKEKKV
ncbi:hypothetical protein GCM10008949_47550 [Deinococcus humi]|nr:hypothetical protein GCM10008949_47550 [Deinococcus humi]